MWICKTCAEKIDSGFEVCWQCGTSFDGEVDPEFTHADEQEPIPNPDPLQDGPKGKDFSEEAIGEEFAGQAPLDLVDCYWARDHMEAHMIVDELLQRGIPAVTDGEHLRAGIGAAAFGAAYFSSRVRVRSQDLPRARQWLANYEEGRKLRSSKNQDDVDSDLDDDS
ncbi:hypothetical protein BH23PLA1_BH23PLA1_19230 [soil metagenome]